MGHQPEHDTLAIGQLGETVAALVPADQAGDHLGVDHGTAVAHAAHCRPEIAQVRYPILEQVAHATAAVGDQTHDVLGLDVAG